MAMIINFDKQEYLLPDLFGEEPSVEAIVNGWDGTKTALACLLADGNNRGGGDLRSDHPIVGSWAGCRVGMVSESDTVPEFSVPGLEHIPLATQMRSTGKDISNEILQAIAQAEGDYFEANKIARNCALSPSFQRKHFNGSGFFQHLKKDIAPDDLSLLWPLMAAELTVSRERARKNLQEGINTLRAQFGVQGPIEIQSLTISMGQACRLGPGVQEGAAHTIRQVDIVVFDTQHQALGEFTFKADVHKPSEMFRALIEIDLYPKTLSLQERELEKAKQFVSNLMKGIM